ncbi:MAG: hypothetical protein RIE73_08735 [Coleofasciculus sp. C1-SOL-03]
MSGGEDGGDGGDGGAGEAGEDGGAGEAMFQTSHGASVCRGGFRD